MIQVKFEGELINLPANITTTDDLLNHISSLLNINRTEFILSFNNIFLSRFFNYNLLEIGFNTREYIDITRLNVKKAVFTIPKFDYDFYLDVDQYSNVFTTKQYFSKLFCTVPQNIIILYKSNKLLDSDNLLGLDSNNSTPFQIEVPNDYTLVRTYFHEIRFVCIKKNSKIKQLKDTISIYSQENRKVNTTCTYSDHLIDIMKQNDFDIDSSDLELLSSSIPLFEFKDLKNQNSKIYTITANITNDNCKINLTRNYDASCQLSLYSLTILIERDLGIDRSLFSLINNRNLSDDIVSDKCKEFSFKISNILNVIIDGGSRPMTYLTTIKDLQEMEGFENHNFGIIINNHFAYFDQSEDFLLINFLNDNQLEKSAQKDFDNELLFVKSSEPCRQITFIKEENKNTNKKVFIVPQNLSMKQIAITYLHQNIKSIKIIKQNKNEITYTNSKKQLIECTLLGVSNFFFKNHNLDESFYLSRSSPRVIDLLTEIYNHKQKSFVFSTSTHIFKDCNNTIISLNDKQLNYFDHLSDIFFDQDNRIKIQSNDDKSEIQILNLINNSCNNITYRDRLQTKQIINKYSNCKDISLEYIKLYADFNELLPNDIPTLIKIDSNLLIINQVIEQKKLIVKNLNNLTFELNIKKEDYCNIATQIHQIFNIPIDKLKISANINEIEYILPPTFNAGSFPNNCEIIVQYEYFKTNKMEFKHENKTKIIEINADDLIENIIPKIQQEFNLWNLSRSSIYLTFYNFNLLLTQSLSFYQIPEKAIINVCIQKNIFQVKIFMPENEYFEKYSFTEIDVINDVKKHFEFKFGRSVTIYNDKEKTNVMDLNTNLYNDMVLYLSGEEISLICEGSLKDEEIKICEILKVREAVKFLINKFKMEVYIFTKNTENIYEPAEEEKMLYEFDNPLFVHKCYSSIKLNYPILENKEYIISELNTVGWFKKAFICKNLFLNSNDFDILNSNDNMPLNDTDLIKNVLNRNNKKLIIYIKDKNTILNNDTIPKISLKNNQIDDIKITYNIIYNNDPMTTISLKKSTTVKKLITKIAMKNNIDPNLVTILFHDEKLSKYTIINDLVFHENDFIHVIINKPEDLFNMNIKRIDMNWSKEKDDYDSDETEPENEEDAKDIKKSKNSEDGKEEEDSEKTKNKNDEKEEDKNDEEENKNEEEEEKNEEDIFTSKNKKIFRTISTKLLDKLCIIEKIGRGATSDVFKVKYDKYPTQVYALKVIDYEIIKLDDDDDDDDSLRIDIDKMRKFINEYEVLNYINHPYIIKTYGICFGDKTHTPSILLEYCPSNLKKMVKKLSKELKIEIIYELSEAMKKIHEAGIIHRDLKPENILIDESNHVKVSDFGICTFINIDSETASRTQLAGTMQFMAPELLNGNKNYDEKVDVYSFGVIVYWILTKGKYPSITFVEIANGKQATIPESFTDLSREIIQQCWSTDPKQRPSFVEICQILEKRRNELI